MADIYYDIAGFTAPLPNGLACPSGGNHRVRLARLVWAATTIGTTPFGPGLRAGGSLELQWRSAMLRASIEPARGAYWRSTAYDRLDPAEKGAVSFFLGQAQTKVFAHDFFRVSRLTRYDAYLAYQGRPRQQTRPDFIGFYGSQVALAVEAKGRSLGLPSELVTKAKKQAATMPQIEGYPSPTRYVHVAYFYHGQWCAYLEDPPGRRRVSRIEPAALTVAYYRPIVQAIRGRERLQRELEDAAGTYVTTTFAEADLAVSVRADIVDLIQTDDLLTASRDRRIRAAALYDLVLALDDQQVAQGREPALDDNLRFLGGDGVAVELGDSWATWADRTGG